MNFNSAKNQIQNKNIIGRSIDEKHLFSQLKILKLWRQMNKVIYRFLLRIDIKNSNSSTTNEIDALI